jgi:uncharacterized protein
MPFNLFHKKKQPDEQTLSPSVQEQTPTEEQPQVAQDSAPTPELSVPTEAPKQEPESTTDKQETPPIEQPQEAQVPTTTQQPQEPESSSTIEQKPVTSEPASKTYLKAMPLKDLSDIENVKNEIRNGNIIILRITPLAGKSIEDVKTAVNELFQFAESIQGDIARLGEERVVICPKTIRIWREKSPAPVSNNQPLPTAA